MQTNCLLQQFVLAGQNPVSSYRLMPPLRFALLFYFFFHFSIEQQHRWDKPRPPVEAPSAHNESLNQYLSSDKKVPRVFFFFSFGGSEALFKGAWLFLPQCNSKGPWHFFFFLCPTTFRDLGQIGLQLQQRPQEEERQISQDWRPLSEPWHRQVTTKKIKSKKTKQKQKKTNQTYLLPRSTSVFFFSICHCNSRKVRYIIRSGVEARARGTLPFCGLK